MLSERTVTRRKTRAAPHLGGAHEAADLDPGRTPAQWYCLLVGLALVLAGALGFLVNGSFSDARFGLDFDDGEFLNGDLFLGLEVNGWHNVVHIATGALLLLGAWSRGAAKSVALAFGLAYVAVTVIGFIDGDDALNLITINLADNLLHAALAVTAILAALLSPPKDAEGRVVGG